MFQSCHFSSLTKTPSATEPFTASESEYQMISNHSASLLSPWHHLCNTSIKQMIRITLLQALRPCFIQLICIYAVLKHTISSLPLWKNIKTPSSTSFSLLGLFKINYLCKNLKRKSFKYWWNMWKQKTSGHLKICIYITCMHTMSTYFFLFQINKTCLVRSLLQTTTQNKLSQLRWNQQNYTWLCISWCI